MVMPSNRWFPGSLQEQAAWFTVFNTNFQNVGASLGFTAAEMLQVAQDWETFDYIANAVMTVDAYSKAVRSYRSILCEGNIGDPTPDFPSDISFSLPFDRPTGLFERLDNIVKRTRVAPAYTDEIGNLLGIIPSAPEVPEIGSEAPEFTAFPEPGSIVSIKFTKSGSSGLYLETRLDAGSWTFADKAIKTPALLNIPAGTDGNPRAVEIRARFLDGNTPVGPWSDTVNVQSIP